MTDARAVSQAAPFRRDGVTLAAYMLLAAMTMCSGMIGPLIPWLREALALSYREAAYHTVAMSVGVTGTALIVPRVAAAIGRKACVLYALAALSGGLALVCLAPALAVSVAGCVMIGTGVPFAITVVPAVMAERHGPHTGVAMAEANAIAYLGFLFAPAFVSVAAAQGDWRWSFVAPAAIYLGYWLAIRRLDFGVIEMRPRGAPAGTLPAAYWAHWAMLALSIGAEMALLIWGPSYLETVLKASRGQALWASMAFPAGMAAGRIGVAALLRRRRPDVLALPSMLLGAAGVLVVLCATGLGMASLGLLAAGLGIAGLYPFGITLMLEAAGPARDRAAARASLASGMAALFGPLLVGIIADRHGLLAAFGAVPAFLLLAAAAHATGRRARRRISACG